MALFRDLTRTIALSEGMSEMAVTGIGQYLRDAGLISKHGRGRAAAAMSTEDAANLLIGINSTDLAKNAPEATVLFGALHVVDEIVEYLDDDLFGVALRKPASLKDCIAGLLRAYKNAESRSDEQSDLTLRVTFRRPVPSVEIWLGYDQTEGEPQETLCWLIFSNAAELLTAGDRSDSTTITHKTIAAVSAELRN